VAWYRQRYAANLRRELPRIPFATPTTCHPERSEHRAKHDDHESKDPVPADAQHRPSEEFSARTHESSGENSPPSQSKTQASTRSFDSAQDDNGGEMSNLDVFRAFARAGQRLAEIHVHYQQQPEYPLTKKEPAKNSTTASPR
jgi:predicted helicase